jgi:hypothetical protein
MSTWLIQVTGKSFLGKRSDTAKTEYQSTKHYSPATVQKISGHHRFIRTANITNILNISIDLYFKKKYGVPKVRIAKS